MGDADCLWHDSPAWRWVFCCTVLATALCILAAPWRLSPAPPTVGQYQAPAPATARVQAAPTSQNRQSPRDPAFDRPVTIAAQTYGSDVEMHVVGVYGPATSGQQSIEWIQACKAVMGTPQMIDCRRQFDTAHAEYRTINVDVERSTAPMVLVLMAYEAVSWKIAARPGIDLRKVIVAGYSGPDIQGVPNGVPVEVYSHGLSPCSNCSRQPGGFWAYDASKPEYSNAMLRFKSLTGLEPTSFQGGYQGDHFTIQRWLGNKQTPLKNPAADDVAGKVFSNFIDLAGKTLPLPDGAWEVLATDNAPSPRGQDRMLVLSRSDKGRLLELMVTHLETATDNNGFPAYGACTLPADYAARLELNQPRGLQQCYWVNHSEAPWQQPVYRAAASRLKDRGFSVPDSALVSGFHRATRDFSVTTQYYAFSDQQPPATADWSSNPWNPVQIKSFDSLQKFVKGRVDWASGWFMLVNAMR